MVLINGIPCRGCRYFWTVLRTLNRNKTDIQQIEHRVMFYNVLPFLSLDGEKGQGYISAAFTGASRSVAGWNGDITIVHGQ